MRPIVIDADEVIKNLLSLKAPIEYSEMQVVNNDVIDNCIGEINATPTLDVKPVIHAHWISKNPNKRTGKAYEFICSNCKRAVFTNRQKSINELGYVFCPHCAAKMDEVEE